MSLTKHKQHVSKEHDALPSPLNEAISALKQDTQVLAPEIENKLYHARQQALKKFAERKSQTQTYGSVLSWAMFINPRMVGVGVLSVCMLLGVGLFHIQQKNTVVDTLLLSADLPPEAFVDNGFEPWLVAQENI